MELNWLHSLLYGLIAGLTDILPVSAQAHKSLLLKFLGIQTDTGVLDAMIHLAIFGALYFCCQSHLIRMNRARALARLPKRKRKRPLDVNSMMDWRMLKTMILPVVLSVFLYGYTERFQEKLFWIALFLLLNGIVMYVPQFFPGSNRDSRTLSRVEGLLMGFGGGLTILPGFSAIGAATAIGSVCGVDRSFALNMALMMNMALNLCMAIYDLLNLNVLYWSFGLILQGLLAAAAAFGGVLLGVNLLKRIVNHFGYAMFGIYCWGLALFTFILNLVA